MNGVKRFAKNISYQMILNVSNGVVMFVFAVIAANKLGPEEFGKFSLVQVFSYMLNVLSDFGMSSALVKGIAKENGKSNYYLSNLMFVKLAFTAMGLLVIYAVSVVLGYPSEFRILLLIGNFIVIPQSIVIYVGATFNAHERMGFSTIPGLTVNILAYGTCCVFLLAGCLDLILIFFLLAFFNLALALVYVRLLNRYFFKFRWELDVKSWKTLFRDSFPFFVISSSGIVGYKIDNVILSRIKNETQVGYYNVATKIHQVFIYFVSACSTVFFPFFSRLEKESEERHLKAFALVMKIMSVFGFAVLIYVPLFSADIVELLFPGYASAVSSVIILSVSTFLIFLTTVTNVVLYSMDKQNVVSWIMVAGMIINVILNAFLIPVYGIEGASISATVFSFIQFISGYVYISLVKKKKTGYLFAFIKLVAVSVVTAVTVLFLKPVNSILSIVISFALFCLLLFLTRVFNRTEIELLREIPFVRDIPFVRGWS